MNKLVPKEQNTVSHEQIFLTNVRKELGTVADSFFKIGFELYQAQNGKYYERLGYPDMETLAEEEFGFGRSTFYGLISVYAKTCLARGENEMEQQYIGYSYSQLLAMTKNEFSPPNYKKYIAVTDSVRDVQKYIRYWREYVRKHSTYPRLTLQQWKAEQGEEIKAIPSNTQSNKQFKGQMSIEEIPSAPSKENKIEPTQTLPKEKITPPVAPTPSVQTFGPRDTAEDKKPKYEFLTRAGVRAFCADYKNWGQHCDFIGKLFTGIYSYQFKNGVRLIAATTKVIQGTGELFDFIEQPQFFIQLIPNETASVISQNQIEKFCAKYKAEL